MRRRLKTGAVFLFCPGRNLRAFSLPKNILKKFQKSGTICAFHIVLYVRVKEKSFVPAQLNDRPNGDMLPGEVCHDRKSASVPTGEIRLENSKAGTAFGKNGKFNI